MSGSTTCLLHQVVRNRCWNTSYLLYLHSKSKSKARYAAKQRPGALCLSSASARRPYPGRGGAPGEDEDEGEGEDKKDEDWCTSRITAQRSDSTSNMFPPRPPRIFRQRTGQDAFCSLILPPPPEEGPVMLRRPPSPIFPRRD
ncbi:hypothetical protein CGMCC3_g15590 [Colletotrichum fructicola]|nr:uncharacterized protein CGMCC3_g15590 [Colletotrichum fructicola]KAE9568318.1 hypothetical protein CGMCC3_g15590 [Colletotrichum fructicola]